MKSDSDVPAPADNDGQVLGKQECPLTKKALR